jgi:hypothetical protein
MVSFVRFQYFLRGKSMASGKPVVATKTIAMDILKIGFIWQRLKKII